MVRTVVVTHCHIDDPIDVLDTWDLSGTIELTAPSVSPIVDDLLRQGKKFFTEQTETYTPNNDVTLSEDKKQETNLRQTRRGSCRTARICIP